MSEAKKPRLLASVVDGCDFSSSPVDGPADGFDLPAALQSLPDEVTLTVPLRDPEETKAEIEKLFDRATLSAPEEEYIPADGAPLVILRRPAPGKCVVDACGTPVLEMLELLHNAQPIVIRNALRSGTVTPELARTMLRLMLHNSEQVIFEYLQKRKEKEEKEKEDHERN